MSTLHKTAGHDAAFARLGLEKEAFLQALPALATAARAGVGALRASPGIANAGRALNIAGRQGMSGLRAAGAAMKPGLQQAGQAIANSPVGQFGRKAISALNSPMGQAASTAAMVAPAVMGK